MSFLLMGSLLYNKRKLRKKRARRTRQPPNRKLQPRPETTLEELDSEDNSGPANVDFPDGMTDGVKESVHAPEREEELDSVDNSGPGNVDFPGGMADGVKQSVHAPEIEEEPDSDDSSDPDGMGDGVQREFHTVRMKEEWEYCKRLRAKASNEEELFNALNYKELCKAIKLAAVELLNEALGMSDGWKLYQHFEYGMDHFTCRLSEDERKLVQGHKDVKEVILCESHFDWPWEESRF